MAIIPWVVQYILVAHLFLHRVGVILFYFILMGTIFKALWNLIMLLLFYILFFGHEVCEILTS